MKRMVAPVRWSAMNRIEHPPLMMKQLFQGVCGGLRWLEAQNMAEYIAKKAMEDGFPSTKEDCRALGAVMPKKKHKRRPTRLHSSPPPPRPSPQNDALVSTEHALVSSSGQLALSRRERRLVTYDVLDCTFGGGYHTGAVLENGHPYTRVIALDCDVDARHVTSDILDEFGGSRFRFFTNRMSEIHAMFGERAFDAVMIDPGPSMTQLEDPERGFILDNEHNHTFDMRYSRRSGVSTLEYLNTVPQHALAQSLASYQILTPQQSMKLARAIRVHRPITGSMQLLEVVEGAGNELPEEGWLIQESRRKTPMSWKFLASLRCVINHEYTELAEAVQQAFLVLKEDGRLVVFTRLGWEEQLVSKLIRDHPHVLLSYKEDVDFKDVESYGHTRHTKMWVATRIKQSAFVLKNTDTLTADTVRESSVRWLNGLFAGQTHGFPAHNFTFEGKDTKEWRIERRNKQPPPLDHDEKP
ncbi:S-adenosyl-methyltransferase mraW-like protein [Strigomonas culicis]|uniref:S-adenosyl-methyltransferase mraW-like protein n=1 Tax=Strigomonas culicis TaxID=28005 RepID=S9V150_9TRYP|nr:S-adenosyl-methyltransferase mraW-like protein [Strigomonas culicis]|eukprot:EPY20586.1 S-adenosyl-methyltransferase mraW-like protein [Strigomonas culicis]